MYNKFRTDMSSCLEKEWLPGSARLVMKTPEHLKKECSCQEEELVNQQHPRKESEIEQTLTMLWKHGAEMPIPVSIWPD